MIGLIVTGHGHFASGLTEALNVIAGPAENYYAVDFNLTDSTDDLAAHLEEAMNNLKDCESVLVLSDGWRFAVQSQRRTRLPKRL